MSKHNDNCQLRAPSQCDKRINEKKFEQIQQHMLDFMFWQKNCKANTRWYTSDYMDKPSSNLNIYF